MLQVERAEEYWTWVGLHNPRVLFAYWKRTGDAFPVASRGFKTVKKPQGGMMSKYGVEQQIWPENYGQKNTMSTYQVERSHDGCVWLNRDFHSNDLGREVINELDNPVFAAYGISDSRLKNQLEFFRARAIHEYSLDEVIK